MTPLDTVRNLIDQAADEYEECWTFLCSWKEGRNRPASTQILDFQPKLANAIFKLGHLHESLAKERTSLIRRKKNLSPTWFRRRMSALAGYQNALAEAIKIGRVIGDSFAWIFYQGERDRFRKHFLHEPIFKIPSGLGGRGEIAFVKRFGVFNGHLLIYHGITSFLRIGDVSFWNPISNTITAIGELKAGKPTESGFPMRLHLIWPETSKSFWPKPKQPAAPVLKSQPTSKDEQLRKQLNRMATSLSLPQFRQVIKVHHQMHFNELSTIADKLDESASAVVRVGDGLILMGLRHSKGESLSSQLLPKRPIALNKRLAGIEAHALSIIDMSQVDHPDDTNRFFIGALDFVAFPGTAPILWWPISSEFARKMIFHEVTVTAIYNPAHLVRKLKAAGYDVKLQRKTMIVSKVIDGVCVVFGNMHHFLTYVQRHLLREEAVINIFQRVLDGVKAEKLSENTRIDLDTQLFY